MLLLLLLLLCAYNFYACCNGGLHAVEERNSLHDMRSGRTKDEPQRRRNKTTRQRLLLWPRRTSQQLWRGTSAPPAWRRPTNEKERERETRFGWRRRFLLLAQHQIWNCLNCECVCMLPAPSSRASKLPLMLKIACPNCNCVRASNDCGRLRHRAARSIACRSNRAQFQRATG